MIKLDEEYFSLEERNWSISRKEFLKSLVLLGLSSQLPFLSSCDKSSDPSIIDFDCSPLTIEQTKTLRTLLLVLFPDDGNGPSALDINTDKYIIWLLNDERIENKEKKNILENINKLESHANNDFSCNFFQLSIVHQKSLLKTIEKEKWGSKFLSKLINHIFEALLLDPIYGVNPNEVGWEWLHHNPGYPRPIQSNKYPEILLNHAV